MDEARSNGGTQAYKGHSQYMRGKKIKVNYIPEEKPEQSEATEQAATQEPVVPERQSCVIDGEVLEYDRSVSWEVFPGNIEVFVDTGAYFMAFKTFDKVLDADSQRQRVVKEIIDKIWDDFD